MKSTALFVRRLAIATGIVAVLAGCSDTVGVIHGPTPVDPLFQSYVALGNSITSGYQSGGINDSTQRESYAYLLAHSMNTRYAYAALDTPGCPPPIVNFQTQARLGGGSATTCAFRSPASVTTALNNVAVPGATSLDPTSVSTAASNALTTFILGGKTQVQRAADAQPTFVSAWIGNNDVLPAAVSGLLTATPGYSPGITPEAQFETNYNAMVTGLQQISSIRGGVLIGVVQVAAAPVLFPAAALFNPAFKHGFDQFTAKNPANPADTTVLLPSCTPTTKSLISFEIVSAIRSGVHPDSIGCEKQSLPAVGPSVGDIFVLDSAEQVQLTAAVNGYNTFIQTTANTLGWAYYDPNVTLTALKTSGCIATVLNLGDPLQPFGPCVTLDGIHPSAQAHKTVANAMIDVINAKYSTHLIHVQ
jgi:lysophospholipase L1-like esterase